jgi:hypothetical protein
MSNVLKLHGKSALGQLIENQPARLGPCPARPPAAAPIARPATPPGGSPRRFSLPLAQRPVPVFGGLA